MTTLVDSTPPAPPYDVFAYYGQHIIERSLPALPPYTSPIPQAAQVGLDRKVAAQQDPAELGPVGIIGAGVGGLYAAMILESLGIPFQILEASNRVGGRLFTYRFDKKESNGEQSDDLTQEDTHDYFDVGAMRFPKIPLMNRLFHLFKYPKLNTHDIKLKDRLITYTWACDNSFKMFNDQRLRIKDIPMAPADPFIFGKVPDDPSRGNVNKQDIAQGYGDLIAEAIDPFIKRLNDDLKTPGRKVGWNHLMRFDKHSARSYMAINREYELPTISWMETMDSSSASYDRALAEIVLDAMAFGDDPAKIRWKCIDGGAEMLPRSMKKYLDKVAPGAIETNKFVNKISAIGSDKNYKEVRMRVQVAGEPEEREYPFVISTIPLPCLRTIDLDGARLSWDQTNALRQLRYGPSTKIGIKFKSAWWKTMKTKGGDVLDIEGGISYTDRSVRMVVYPSYGRPGSEYPTTVLLASYAWTDDASGLAALIGPLPGMKEQVKEDATKRLKQLVLRDLSAIHDIELKDLENEYVDHFAWDWTQDPLAQGAFAFFGPGNFSTLYESMNRPAGNGRLHFAGEALSVRHAWVVGALDSAWAAVKRILILNYPDKLNDFEKIWGENEEWQSGGRKPSPGPQKPPGAPQAPPGAPWEPAPWGEAPKTDLLMRHLFANNPEWFD